MKGHKSIVMDWRDETEDDHGGWFGPNGEYLCPRGAMAFFDLDDRPEQVVFHASKSKPATRHAYRIESVPFFGVSVTLSDGTTERVEFDGDLACWLPARRCWVWVVA